VAAQFIAAGKMVAHAEKDAMGMDSVVAELEPCTSENGYGTFAACA
jgi:hypothetical protein